MAAALPEEAIVIGASFGGLCAAWQLKKRGVQRVTVLEKRRVGHRSGAGHGRTRLLSLVGFEDPVQGLLKLARDKSWPELERDVGRRVVRRIEGLGMGPLSPRFANSAKAGFGQPDDVKAIPLPSARQRFPQLVLPEGTGTVVDGTAQLIASEVASDALRALLEREGVRVVPNTEVTALASTSDGLWLETNRGRWVAERVIVTAGTGTGELLDRAESRMSVRTLVSAFYSLDLPDAQWRAGRFPAVRVVDEAGQAAWTVVPEFADRGVKVTRHTTEEAGDAAAQLEALKVWFEDSFQAKVTGLLGREVRQVVRITDRPMVIDTHHDDPRIVFATGHDGQEVALGPILGTCLAQLVLDGRSEIDAFQRNRKHFALPRRSLPTRRKRRARAAH